MDQLRAARELINQPGMKDYTASDLDLDEDVRSVFDKLIWRIETGSTIAQFLQKREKWTVNLEHAYPGLMPPYCAATAQAEKTGCGRGVVLLRKDVERHTTPTTTRYACHLPVPEDMTRRFYASGWIADLVTGSGDFSGVLRHYVERTVKRLEYWNALEHDEALAAIVPVRLLDSVPLETGGSND